MSLDQGPQAEGQANEGRAAGEEVALASAGLLQGLLQEEAAWKAVLVPLLAFITALAIGGILIVFSDVDVLHKWAYFFSAPGDALSSSWHSVYGAYSALFVGSLGGRYALSETVVQATPLIFTGLAVALGFRAGLFNIGAEGQLFAGGLAAAYVGFSWTGLPAPIHLPLALLAGFAGGAIWGFIPGFLKARTGAHEVITTIMLNFIALSLANYLLLNSLFRRPGRTDAISKPVAKGAQLPRLAGGSLRIHAGIIVALLVAWGVYWLLYRTTKGFEFRAVGSNPDAARTSGINVPRTYIVVMLLSGGLAGLAGANQLLGIQYSLAPGFSAGLGFDAIALALLGRAHPFGVVAAAFLIGLLRAGAIQMQVQTSIPVDIVGVLQALIIVFIAAPSLVRAIYRIKARRVAGPQAFSKGWSG
jgi:simple sugar transport system permease protein